jgi:hypothetical protein
MLSNSLRKRNISKPILYLYISSFYYSKKSDGAQMFLLKVRTGASFSKKGSSVRNPNTLLYKQAQNQIFLGQTSFLSCFRRVGLSIHLTHLFFKFFHAISCSKMSYFAVFYRFSLWYQNKKLLYCMLKLPCLILDSILGSRETSKGKKKKKRNSSTSEFYFALLSLTT